MCVHITFHAYGPEPTSAHATYHLAYLHCSGTYLIVLSDLIYKTRIKDNIITHFKKKKAKH